MLFSFMVATAISVPIDLDFSAGLARNNFHSRPITDYSPLSGASRSFTDNHKDAGLANRAR